MSLFQLQLCVYRELFWRANITQLSGTASMGIKQLTKLLNEYAPGCIK